MKKSSYEKLHNNNGTTIDYGTRALEQLRNKVLFDRLKADTKVSNNRRKESLELFPFFIMAKVPNNRFVKY